MRQIHWVQGTGFENTPPPPPQKTIEPHLNTHPTRERKKSEDGFQEKTTTDFCSICSSIPASSSLYETLKPESSVAAALLLFQSCRLVHPVESCMKETKEKKTITNDNSNNENLLYVGGKLYSVISGFFSSFSLFCKCLSVSLSLSSLWDLFLFSLP